MGFMWLRIGTSGGALVNTVMNLRVPLSILKFLSNSPTSGFPRITQFHGVTLVSGLNKYLRYF
jgi:hypothetical protein